MATSYKDKWVRLLKSSKFSSETGELASTAVITTFAVKTGARRGGVRAREAVIHGCYFTIRKLLVLALLSNVIRREFKFEVICDRYLRMTVTKQCLAGHVALAALRFYLMPSS